MSDNPSSTKPLWLVWIIERALAVVLAFILLRSAFSHLSNIFYFLSSVYSYNIASPFAGKIIALVVPHAELVLGTVLMLGLWKRAAYLLTALLFAIFASAQLLALSQGLKISCGCYGAEESLEIGSISVAIALIGCLASLIGAVLTHSETLSCSKPDLL